MEHKRWKVLSTREIFRSGMFTIRTDRCELPDGRIMPNYYVFTYSNWVQVIPVTRDRKAVLVRQYRHAIGADTLEFPGGTTGSFDPSLAEAAGLRELREETGFTSSKVELAGRHYPNPASQTNELFTFIAWDCEKTMEQELDPFEDIEVELYPLEDLPGLVRSGKIRHSLVVTSLFYALPQLGLKNAL